MHRPRRANTIALRPSHFGAGSAGGAAVAALAGATWRLLSGEPLPPQLVGPTVEAASSVAAEAWERCQICSVPEAFFGASLWAGDHLWLLVPLAYAAGLLTGPLIDLLSLWRRSWSCYVQEAEERLRRKPRRYARGDVDVRPD